MDATGSSVIELPASGPADPDGSRAAAAIDAWIQEQQARVFRRVLFRRLERGVALLALVQAFTHVLPVAGLLVALGAIGVAAGFGVRVEQRAGRGRHTSVAASPLGGQGAQAGGQGRS
jgi:hypothetical protein